MTSMEIEHILEHGTFLLSALGVLAFAVSVITQVIKDFPVLKKIQTNLLALILSMILTPLSVVALCQSQSNPSIEITWYYMVAAVIAGFVVYLISTGGWERVSEIWNRCKYDSNKPDVKPDIKQDE